MKRIDFRDEQVVRFVLGDKPIQVNELDQIFVSTGTGYNIMFTEEALQTLVNSVRMVGVHIKEPTEEEITALIEDRSIIKERTPAGKLAKAIEHLQREIDNPSGPAMLVMIMTILEDILEKI
jgi:predicted nucleic-acid-binding protein